MFAINGPSGPTSRNERRVVTDAERKLREEARKQQAKRKGESFFDARKTPSAAPKVAPIASAGSKRRLARSTSASGASNVEQAPDSKKQAQRDNIAAKTQIFKVGCRIIFNGRTGNISSYYLAKLVQDHGGNVCSALTSAGVTHMVGANLSGSKAQKVIKAAGKVKVVSPEWILQSVKHKKRQAEFDFLLYKDAQQLR
ncbi:hypothetical protein Gpo141_00006590 [Globisporangium polare]